jgi:Leu/Phe-tRNA-protein transferase
LGRFGCKEIEAKKYEKLLEEALKIEAEFTL